MHIDDTTAPITTVEMMDAVDEIIEFPADWRPDAEIAEGRQAFFEEMLSTVDIPEPDGRPTRIEEPSDDLFEKSVGPEFPTNQVDEPLDDLTQKVELQNDGVNGNAENNRAKARTDGVQDEPTVTIHPSVLKRNEIKSQTDDPSVPNYLKETLATPVPDYLMDTLPTPTRVSIETLPTDHSDKGNQTLDSVLPRLTYACVLLPQLAQHHLIGDLASFLNRCVVQVGNAFGWRMEHLSIRPSYLHWVTEIPPGTSPGHMVRIIRDHASHRIFSQFPQLALENTSGDFWATGYLIVNGKYPLSHQLVEDFLYKTRSQQAQPHSHTINRH
jgi:REP element-mobilizing transposase RayT